MVLIIYGGRNLSTRKIRSDKENSAASKEWKQALVDARRKLSECQIESSRLSTAIQIIQKKIEDCEPWPGDSSTHN
jgi:hypothetical protein